MNKLLAYKIVVAASLFLIVAESAWSEEAASSAPAEPAEQAASPAASNAQGYAPATYPRGYERRWQPSPWPAPPPPRGYYGHYRSYYPPQRQNWNVPAAPPENPLSGELKQTQEQLATRDTELSTAREGMANLQAEQQAIREAMQQAQSEIAKAGEQLSVVVEEMDILYEVLSKLKSRLDTQNTSLLGALQAGAEANDKVDSAVTSEVEQAQSPASASVQPDNAGGESTQEPGSEPAKPEGQ